MENHHFIMCRWLGSLGSLGSGFLDLKSSTGEENPSLVTGFDLSCEAVGIDKTLRCVWWSLCMLYIYRIKETHYIHVFKHVTGVIYPYLCWGHKRCCMKSDPLKLWTISATWIPMKLGCLPCACSPDTMEDQHIDSMHSTDPWTHSTQFTVGQLMFIMDYGWF